MTTPNTKPIISLLEAGKATPAGQLSLLLETFTGDITVVNDPYRVERKMDESTGRIELVEVRTGEGPMKIAGTFQCEGLLNANKRIYPLGLWEKRISDAKSPLMEKISSRGCTGHIEHPASGASDLKQTAILVTGLKMMEKRRDGSRPVWGEAEITECPDGRIVRDLVRSGVRIGISSRATGVVDDKGIVEDSSFNPITWDVVGSPSTPGAYLNVVKESCVTPAHLAESTQEWVKSFIGENGSVVWETYNAEGRKVRSTELVLDESRKHGDTKMATPALKARLEELTRAVQLNLDSVGTPGIDAGKLDGVLTEQSIEIARIAEEDKTLVPPSSFLQARIAEARATLAKPAAKVAEDKKDDDKDDDDSSDESSDDDKAPPFKKKDESVAESTDDEDGNESTQEDNAGLVEGTVEEQLEYAKGLLVRAGQEIAEKDAQIAELTEAGQAAVAELAEANAGLAEELEEIQEAHAAALQQLQEMTGEEGGETETVAEAVTRVIAENPNLESLKPMLEKQKDVAGVENIAESVAKPSTAVKGTDSSLPNKQVVESTKGSAAQQTAAKTGLSESAHPVSKLLEATLNRNADANKGKLATRING